MQSAYLPLLLTSLAHQVTSDKFEILICDDGSTNETLDAIRCVIDSVGLDIRYIWQPHKGFRLARSRNNAVRCARGEILLFLDGDTIARADSLSKHIAAHKNQERVLVCGSRSHVFMDGLEDPAIGSSSGFGLFNRLQPLALFSTVEAQGATIDSPAPWAAIVGCNFSVPRTPLIEFDEIFEGWGCEDQELACRLVCRHKYVTRCPDELEVLHLETGDPASFRHVRPRSSAEIEAYVRNLVYFSRKYPDVDMLPVWYSLRLFELDTKSQRWHAADRQILDHTLLDIRIREACLWYDSLPDPARMTRACTIVV